jgi:hypothetical protein
MHHQLVPHPFKLKKLNRSSEVLFEYFSVDFVLDFGEIKQRIDLKQLLSFNNWNHVAFLSVYECGWFNDDDWKALVEHAANFKNLEELDLGKNV